jgi:ubiquinone/menaquinone biosynthesis C-methylase UbiE
VAEIMIDSKKIELERYNQRAESVLLSEKIKALREDGSAGVAVELRSPYIAYENLIRSVVKRGSKVLDLCCGDGQHSLPTARLGVDLTVSDIAPKNIELTLARASREELSVKGLVADSECLPESLQSFDLVTCSGSISYVDLDLFLKEVLKVLKPGGHFIAVDSFNHNPIYRLNRFMHFLAGRRSWSTLRRMPNKSTLKKIANSFEDFSVEYFGLLSFAMPILRRILGSKKSVEFSDFIDHHFKFAKKYAFKIVFICKKPL